MFQIETENKIHRITLNVDKDALLKVRHFFDVALRNKLHACIVRVKNTPHLQNFGHCINKVRNFKSNIT